MILSTIYFRLDLKNILKSKFENDLEQVYALKRI